MNKFIQSVHKRKDYLWLICLVTAVFSVVLIVNGCWPYGESTIVVGDSYSQIGLLFERVFDWLSGGFSAYYTPYGFGMELLSTIEYMFLNPFYLVVLIFGKNNIFISLNMAVYLMLMFNAVVFMWFSKTHFKNLTTVSRDLTLSFRTTTQFLKNPLPL